MEVSLHIIEWAICIYHQVGYWMSLFRTTYAFILNKDKIFEMDCPLPTTQIWFQLACYIRQYYTLLTFILQIFNYSINIALSWFSAKCLWCCSNITIHVRVCTHNKNFDNQVSPNFSTVNLWTQTGIESFFV